MSITRSKPKKIERWRGAQERIPFLFQKRVDDELTPLDISSYTFFKLTVNKVKDPIDITEQYEEMLGSFSTDGTDGRVFFVPSGTDIPVGVSFYDLSYLNEFGEITTKKNGEYDVAQDIGK